MFDTVRSFVALSKQFGVKGSDPEVKELMTTLRRSGFSSSQISELSGGMWSSTLVRQYTTDWGGVDKELDNQRKSLMKPLRDLVSSGKDINDVERVLSLDRSVRAKGSSLEELADLNSNLTNLDMLPGEIEMLLKSSREIHEQHLTPSMVKTWIVLDQELVEAGFDKVTRKLLRSSCQKYGDVIETLEAVNEYNYLSQIQDKHSRLKGEVERLRNEDEELEKTVNQNRDMITAVITARSQGFDTASLTAVSISAVNLGGPYKVAEAIQQYSSIREIDEELRAKKAELENVNKETSDKTQFLKALNYTLKEAKGVYKRNYDVRMVVELLSNPRGIKMDKSEVLKLLTRVLDSSILRIEENVEPLSIPNPAWDAVYERIKILADRLHQFSEA